jgi:parallel beta-helix repeat protein
MISFTGYSHRDYDPQYGSRTRWGVLLTDAEHCTVRRCVAYFNSGGIHLLGGGQHCVVEECEAFGNWSRHVDIGNNIVGWSVAGTTFQRNRVEGHMPDASTSRNDITFYSGGDDCAMIDNLAINASVMIKGDLKDAVQRGNVCVGRKFYRPPGVENLEISAPLTPVDVAKYADVLNHDYRTEQVCFVSPRGNDANPGTKTQPFKTLSRAARTNHTIYLLAGEYPETFVAPSNADVRRHGHDRVLVRAVELRGVRGVKLHGLHVEEDLVAADCENLRIEYCRLTGVRLDSSPNFVLRHNGLAKRLEVKRSPGGSLVSNILPQQAIDDASQAELWTHSNASSALDCDVLPDDSPLIGRGLHGSTVGPFMRLTRLRPLPVTTPTVHDVTATTVTLEWSTPTQIAETTLEWDGRKIDTPRGSQHSVSLNGLQPGKNYEFRVTSLRKDAQRIFATHQPPADTAQAVVATQSVATVAKPAPPRTLHVPGDFATIGDAADAARAGDTVLIHGGVYQETVHCCVSRHSALLCASSRHFSRCPSQLG